MAGGAQADGTARHEGCGRLQPAERAVCRPIPAADGGRGAVILDNADRGRRARSRRCRSRVRDACARTKWGSDGAAGHQHDELSRGDRRAGGAPPRTGDLPVPFLCRERRSNVLRHRRDRGVLACGRLRRPYPQGHASGRATDSGSEQVRISRQPQDRQGARPRRAADSARARRRGHRVKRRAFITLLGGAAAWPLAARAQHTAMPMIGDIDAGSPEPAAHLVSAFRGGLGETGFVEGCNVAIEFRWAHNNNARLPELAADLVRRRVAVIVAPQSTAAVMEAKAATRTIPIVFGTGSDPVQAGLVTSLNRPGGNLTGITFMNVEITAKRFGLLHELLPNATRFGVLINPKNSVIAETIAKDATTAASAMGRQVEIVKASTNRDIESAFSVLKENSVTG